MLICQFFTPELGWSRRRRVNPRRRRGAQRDVRGRASIAVRNLLHMPFPLFMLDVSCRSERGPASIILSEFSTIRSTDVAQKTCVSGPPGCVHTCMCCVRNSTKCHTVCQHTYGIEVLPPFAIACSRLASTRSPSSSLELLVLRQNIELKDAASALDFKSAGGFKSIFALTCQICGGSELALRAGAAKD